MNISKEGLQAFHGSKLQGSYDLNTQIEQIEYMSEHQPVVSFTNRLGIALQDSYAGVAYENRRSKSPELMSEIKKYIEDYYLQNRQSPSTTKIAEAVGIARGTAYKYLVEMAEKNMIEYDGQEIRTNVTRKYSGEQTQTPIVGSIPCGSPQYEEENIEEYVSLPTAIFGKGDFFILRASGQSMIEAGIDDGDLVVVKKQVEAKEGDIVVALVDNQNTLKRYFRDDENKKIILHPENKKMKDIIVDECCIQGVACHIIKEL